MKRKKAFSDAKAPPSRSWDLPQLCQNGASSGEGRLFTPPRRSGLWVDARVASLRCPILRPGTHEYTARKTPLENEHRKEPYCGSLNSSLQAHPSMRKCYHRERL